MGDCGRDGEEAWPGAAVPREVALPPSVRLAGMYSVQCTVCTVELTGACQCPLLCPQSLLQPRDAHLVHGDSSE